MEYAQLVTDILKARDGNELVRHELITAHKPYIINAVSHFSKKYMSWSDEEASIGLIAFNRAIDTFDPERGREFLSFCYILIKRDLISYFRSNSKFSRYLSIDGLGEETPLVSFEVEKSVQDYQQIVHKEEIVEEILELSTSLNEYGIQFEELEGSCPKHKDTREMINNLVLEFTKDEELVCAMVKKKRFPSAVFIRKYEYSEKTVERFRKYIIALVIIRLHPEWIHLAEYIGMGNDGRGLGYA